STRRCASVQRAPARGTRRSLAGAGVRRPGGGGRERRAGHSPPRTQKYRPAPRPVRTCADRPQRRRFPRAAAPAPHESRMKEEVDLLVTDAAEVVTIAADALRSGATPAGRALPLRGAALDDAGVIARGAVAVRDGRIVAVDEAARLAARFTARTTLS